MGVFAKMKDKQTPGGTRARFKEGDHLARVDGCKLGETRKGVGLFAVEYTIVDTNSDDPEMAPGRKVDYACLSTNDMFESNIKGFMCAICRLAEETFDQLAEQKSERSAKGVKGYEDETKIDEIGDMVVGADQLYSGRVIRVICTPNDDGRVFPRLCRITEDEERAALDGFAARKAKVAAAAAALVGAAAGAGA